MYERQSILAWSLCYPTSEPILSYATCLLAGKNRQARGKEMLPGQTVLAAGLCSYLPCLFGGSEASINLNEVRAWMWQPCLDRFVLIHCWGTWFVTGLCWEDDYMRFAFPAWVEEVYRMVGGWSSKKSWDNTHVRPWFLRAINRRISQHVLFVLHHVRQMLATIIHIRSLPRRRKRAEDKVYRINAITFSYRNDWHYIHREWWKNYIIHFESKSLDTIDKLIVHQVTKNLLDCFIGSSHHERRCYARYKVRIEQDLGNFFLQIFHHIQP